MHANLQTLPTVGFIPPPDSARTVPEIPPVIRSSALMKRGGFDVFSGIADEFIRKNLLAEALEQQKVMSDSIVFAPDPEEIRGGAPRRKFLSSAGGNFQRGFYHSQWLIDFLRGLTTPFLRPTGDYGTFSHYSRAGDFLEIHRDIAACDVALITCLENVFGEDKTGGKLCLYPNRTGELLSEIRASSKTGAYPILLEEGETIIFYGGIIPHALLPVAQDQKRIVSVLCYQAL